MRYALIEVEVGIEGTDAWASTCNAHFVVEYDDDEYDDDPYASAVFEQALSMVSIVPLRFLYECDEYGVEIEEDD